MQTSTKINIRPGTKILSILKHIEYDPWFALAEYVDNSIDSYLKYKDELKKNQGKDYCLSIDIDVNQTDRTITIRDNAAGIHKKDYERAFRAAEAPPDNSGLSEFGMGMKSASCWFSDLWTVTTTALGEDVEKTIEFDLNKIYYDNIDELIVTSKKVPANTHYTVITLKEIDRLPKKRTLSKIEKHLASIYRDFLRKGTLNLKFKGKKLTYETPKILNAPFFKTLNGESIIWKQEIELPIEEDVSIHGFIAIREKASTKEAGIALFRRGRVIQGSFDETFRPELIFGRANSFRYQRIFGELHLEGFKVSFTKRGIRWDENMEMFLDLLKHDISHSNFPLMQQAEGFRVKHNKKDLKKTAETILETETKKYKENLPSVISEINENQNYPINNSLTETNEKSVREFTIEHNDITWNISIELSYDHSVKDWIEVDSVSEPNSNIKQSNVKQIIIRLSLVHPFSQKFAGIDKSRIEPLLRIAAAIGLGEKLARDSGVKKAGLIRMNINKILTEALTNI